MTTFTVSLLDTGERFPCKHDTSVLAGMANLGRRGIPCGCRGGGCGVCKVQVLSGQYQARAMSRAHISETEQQAGKVLACRIYPDSDLSLKVLGSLQRCLTRSCDSR
jgi:ferredoxin